MCKKTPLCFYGLLLTTWFAAFANAAALQIQSVEAGHFVDEQGEFDEFVLSIRSDLQGAQRGHLIVKISEFTIIDQEIDGKSPYFEVVVQTGPGITHQLESYDGEAFLYTDLGNRDIRFQVEVHSEEEEETAPVLENPRAH